MLVLDTDHLTALGYDSPPGHRLLARLSTAAQEVVTSAVNVDEQLTGLLAAVHQHKDPAQQMLPYAELVERMEFLAGFTILPWDTESIALFREMKARKVATGTMDLKIGCVALAHDATVLTRNLVDFRRIPGLRVENWLD